jgi:uncharacterized Zn finger protein
MPHQICPKCQRDGRFLEATSEAAWVEYYRCDECGHVWTHDKHKPDSKPRDVTIEPKKAS